MRETLDDIQATGLAAPQIAVDKRVVLYCVPPERIPAGAAQAPVPWTAMINPAITPLTGEKEPIWERCLSLPGLYGKVPRFTRIRADYTTLDGQAVSFDVKGFHAMLVQHECDHLDGVLYPMRMEDLSRFGFVDEITGGGAIPLLSRRVRRLDSGGAAHDGTGRRAARDLRKAAFDEGRGDADEAFAPVEGAGGLERIGFDDTGTVARRVSAAASISAAIRPRLRWMRAM